MAGKHAFAFGSAFRLQVLKSVPHASPSLRRVSIPQLRSALVTDSFAPPPRPQDSAAGGAHEAAQGRHRSSNQASATTGMP
jgi:hypothetical protein